jgi:TRAP-type mannitol/chloroaromatic compound transport system permease small subunit
MEQNNMPKFDRLVQKICSSSADVGTVMLLLLFVLNCSDIVGSKVFNAPVLGVVELTGYLQSLLIPMAAGLVLLYRQHIRIEIVTDKLPERAKTIIDGLVALLLLCLFSVLVWQLFRYAFAIQSAGEYSNTLHLPHYYVIYLTGASLVPFCFALLRDFLLIFLAGDRKEVTANDAV